MGISHVIRGADHHSNTPFQLALYQALEQPPPLFAHLPLIVGAERQEALEATRSRVGAAVPRGRLPRAEPCCNWLARIGWSHGDQEIFSREEILALFDLEKVHRSAAQADAGKLAWLNQHWIKALPLAELLAALLPFLSAAAEQDVARDARAGAAGRPAARAQQDAGRDGGARALPRRRPDRLRPEGGGQAPEARDRAAAAPTCTSGCAALPDWSEPALERVFEEVRARHGDLPMGKLAQPVRVAVTGGAVSPGIYETLAVLGKPRALARIAAAHPHLAARLRNAGRSGTKTARSHGSPVV